MSKTDIKILEVLYNGKTVGTLAAMSDGLIAFEYADSWIGEGFSISPVSLPLTKKLFVPKDKTFGGLFGVFADSLPDSWGSLLMDRMLLRQGIAPSSIGPLARLSFLSANGLGGLTYRPALIENSKQEEALDLDQIKKDCDSLLAEKSDANLDLLFRLGGSSGGARPKAHLSIDNDAWIVKFPYRYDPNNVGVMEYAYNTCAKSCGIEVPEFNLFSSNICSGYFGEKRFDRKDGRRIHVISLSGMLEVSHKVPSLDYLAFLQLTTLICHDQQETMKAFKIMCFNVFAHNYDDHSKNFSFLYDEEKQAYMLTPFYDLTGSSYVKEHEMSVNGQGNPNEDDILACAKKANLDISSCKKVMLAIKKRAQKDLADFIPVANKQ